MQHGADRLHAWVHHVSVTTCRKTWPTIFDRRGSIAPRAANSTSSRGQVTCARARTRLDLLVWRGRAGRPPARTASTNAGHVHASRPGATPMPVQVAATPPRPQSSTSTRRVPPSSRATSIDAERAVDDRVRHQLRHQQLGGVRELEQSPFVEAFTQEVTGLAGARDVDRQTGRRGASGSCARRLRSRLSHEVCLCVVCLYRGPIVREVRVLMVAIPIARCSMHRTTTPARRG